MKAFLIALPIWATGASVLAQPHQGHTEDERPVGSDTAPTASPPPSAPASGPGQHTGHGERPQADHAETSPAQAGAADEHAGHSETADSETPTEAHPEHDAVASEPDAEPPRADPHAAHEAAPADTAPTPPEAPPPPAAFEGPRHAAETVFDPAVMASARELLRAEQGAMRTYRLLADQLEARRRDGRSGYLWDAQGWYGGDINKLWVKTEGEDASGEESEEAEVQALWSRAVTPWFDFQAGVRYDLEPAPERRHLVVGMQGLVPYFFEIDGAAFFSDEGDITARLEAEYDRLITQRLILQPRIELNLAAQDIPELGIGSGLSSAEFGLRLRYEFARELAPYVGIEYERAVGGTADFVRAEGEEVREWSVLLGVRVWF